MRWLLHTYNHYGQIPRLRPFISIASCMYIAQALIQRRQPAAFSSVFALRLENRFLGVERRTIRMATCCSIE